MISALDHVAVAVRDAGAAAHAYQQLLGVAPRWVDGGGALRAWFDLQNMSLEVLAPVGEGPSGDRLRAWLAHHEPGIWAVALSTPDLEEAGHRIERRGLQITERVPGAILIDPTSAAGLQLILTTKPRPKPSDGEDPSSVAALDHVVINTPNPNRALALYGAKLNLDLRLDRSSPEWGSRLLFFRCGDAVVEIGSSLKTPVSDGPDRFGGLAWRVTDAEAAQARIAKAGFDVSEVRKGRKPGAFVFTVRSGVPGAPALMLQPSPSQGTD